MTGNKKQFYIEADIFPTSGTGKSSIQVCHHNLYDMMQGGRCGLEISDGLLTEFRGPQETEGCTASGSSKDASSSGVLTKSVMMEPRSCSKSATAWSKK